MHCISVCIAFLSFNPFLFLSPPSCLFFSFITYYHASPPFICFFLSLFNFSCFIFPCPLYFYLSEFIKVYFFYSLLLTPYFRILSFRLAFSSLLFSSITSLFLRLKLINLSFLHWLIRSLTQSFFYTLFDWYSFIHSVNHSLVYLITYFYSLNHPYSVKTWPILTHSLDHSYNPSAIPSFSHSIILILLHLLSFSLPF